MLFELCANIVWASTFKNKLASIFRTQKHAIRVIYFKDKFAHTKPLFDDVKVMNIYEVNIFQTLSFMFKCKNKDVPAIFERIYNIKINSYNIRSFDKLVEPFYRLKVCDYSISVREPKLWNKLIVSKIININTLSLIVFLKKS